MNAGIRALRTAFFPLTALLGVALLMAGAFEYWRFHRDLYVAESQALDALAELAGDRESVTYVRAGSATKEGTSLDRAPPMPWATPLVSRIESVDAFFDDPVPEATLAPVRDSLLRLSGMRSLQEQHWQLAPSTRPLDLEQALGRPLPALEPRIDEKELAEPMPRGEPVGEAEAESIWKAVRESWLKEPAPDEPYLAVFETSIQRRAELRDGDRRWSYDRMYEEWYEDVPAAKYEEEMTLTQGGVTHFLQADGDAWRITCRLPAEVSTHLEMPPGPIYDFSLGLERLAFPAAQVERVLRPQSVEKVDSVRYRIAFAPCTIVSGFGTEIEYRAIEVVVRSDMDWAVEQSRTVFRDEAVDRRIVRLKRSGDFVYASQAISQTLAPGVDPSPGWYRYAIEFEPKNYESAFDLRSYGVRDWPQAEPLPALRTYRVLFFLGGVAAAIGIVGGAAARLRRRKRRVPHDQEARANGRRSPRRPALRFGFVTLGAAALLPISASGWVKSKLDVVREEDYLLRSSEQPRTQRGEPQLPWSLFATETFPIDAPLREVRVVELSIDTRDRLLKLPTIERFGDFPATYAFFRSEALPPTSLGTPIPKIADSTIADAELEAPLPRGESLSPEETRDLESRLQAAWKKALLRKPPSTYCVLRERRAPPETSAMNYQGAAAYQARLELRDGERYWKAFAGVQDTANVACGDRVWAYRYARREPSEFEIEEPPRWTLAARYPQHAERRDDPLPDVPRDERLHGPRDNDVPLRSPPLPGWFEAVGTDLLSRSLGEGLAKATSLPAVLHAERLGEGRYLVEFEPPRLFWEFPHGKYDLDPWRGIVGISRWVVVANENLDWAIDLSDVEANPAETYLGDPSPPRGRSGSRTVSRSERIDGQTYLVESRTLARNLRTGWLEGEVAEYSSAFAYDFPPTIDERIFRAPSLDYPHPPPDPEAPAIFQWWMATGIFALGGFVFAGIGRLREKRKRKISGRDTLDRFDAADGSTSRQA